MCYRHSTQRPTSRCAAAICRIGGRRGRPILSHSGWAIPFHKRQSIVLGPAAGVVATAPAGRHGDGTRRDGRHRQDACATSTAVADGSRNCFPRRSRNTWLPDMARVGCGVPRSKASSRRRCVTSTANVANWRRYVDHAEPRPRAGDPRDGLGFVGHSAFLEIVHREPDQRDGWAGRANYGRKSRTTISCATTKNWPRTSGTSQTIRPRREFSDGEYRLRC